MYFCTEIVWIFCVFLFANVLCQELPKLNTLSLPDQLSVGSRARLICVASSGDQPIDFQWVKDGKPFHFGKIEQLDEWTSSLKIEPLTLQHSGNYTCIAANRAGRAQVTASLFVTAPPKWIVEPSDVKVRVGETALFPCEAEGAPKIKIMWRKKQSGSIHNLTPLHSTDGFVVYENGTLSVSNADKSKSGVYLCEASNGIGNDLRKRVNLLVYEYPTVERIVDHVTVERGQTAHLSCLANGDPPLTVFWMKNQKRLDSILDVVNRLSYSELPNTENTQFTLSLTNTELSDEGVYTCSARNEFGSDEKDVRLMLIERPHAPQYVEIVDVWSRSARIRWTAPNNGNSPILSYTIEYWSNPGGHWNETILSSTSGILRNLKPFTIYSFRVFASNNVGDSEPSEQMQFTTAKEEPSAPPVDFKLEDVGSTFIRLSWKPPPREDWNGEITGYYVGYKQSTSKLPYTYSTVEAEDDHIFYVLRGLRRATRYLVTVRCFNDVGSGPSSEEIPVKTLDQDPPPQPVLVIKDIGSTYLQVNWMISDNEKLHTSGYTVYYRKNGGKWKEISVPDASQTTYMITNLDSGVPYQIYVTSHGSTGISEPSEIATVRTSAEAIFQGLVPKSPEVQPAVDDVTQILYIVVPVAVATVIIVIVIVTACVYVYSKRPLPVSHPYGDLPASKNFSYMATVPRQRDMPITVCGGNAMKYGSPYSTVPLTRPEQEEDEPIYESVVDEIRCKIKQRSFDEDIKIGNATIV